VSQPIGQSLTPVLSSVGFIRLQLFDVNPGNGQGATLYVNLRTSSITGPILVSSDPILLPDGFPGNNIPGFVNFFFSSSPSVVPGLTYYFQPVVQSGDAWAIGRFVPNYTGGTEYINGQPGNNDLWFREGIVVPEPSSALLVLLGGGVVAWRHRKKPRSG
jgi:PEP-CTERM motif